MYSSKLIGITLFIFLISSQIFSQGIVRFGSSGNEMSPVLRQKLQTAELVNTDLQQLYHDIVNGRQVLNIEAGSGHWTFRLEENALISPDYFVTIAGHSGNEINKGITTKTYFGVAEGRSASISLTIDHDFVNAMIVDGERSLFIEQERIFDRSADQNSLIMYDARDVMPDGTFSCGVTELHDHKDEYTEAIELRTGQCKLLELAIASDATMYTKFSNSVTNVQNHNIAVINNVAFNYRHEFVENIEISIVTQYISTAYANDPLSPNTTSTSASTVLNGFSTWGYNGGFGTAHDLGQFWTNRDFDGSTVGLAWVGSVGAAGYKYHVLQDFTDNATSLRVMTAHEMGHNFGAGHDNSGDPYIMAPSVGASNDWSPASKSAINSKIPTYTGLDNYTGPISAYFVLQPGAICGTGTVQYKDKSVNGKTRTWTFPGGSPSTSSEQQPIVTYNTVGTYSALIESGSSSYGLANAVTVGNAPSLNQGVCPLPTNPPGNAGLQMFSLNGMISISGVGSVDGSIYVDRSCTNIVSLEPSKTYTMSFVVGNCSSTPIIFEAIRVYIDYNGDGDFTDSGEAVLTTGGTAYCGLVSGQITTPASPTMNQLVRLRVITSPSYVSDPCENITNGQVEDFSVVFKQNIPLPINLLTFTGKNDGNANILQWTGKDERSVREYIVERSRDGEHFNEIGFVSAQNRSSVSYTFKDVNADLTSIQYYRLAIIEQSGNVTFSKIVAIDAGRRGFTLERLTRIVPAGGRLTGDIICEKQGKIHISLFDMLGRPVLSNTITTGVGAGNIEIDMADVAAGTYILTLRDETGTVITEKVVKGE